MNMTFEQLTQIVKVKTKAKAWYAALEKFLPKYHIISNEQIAMFLAQTSHESIDFSKLSENMNYTTAARIQKVFAKRLAMYNRSASEFVRNPEGLANLVYANRMGNGAPETGDGFKFRGRGLLHLTGREEYTDFATYIGKSLEQTVSYLETIDGAVESACFFWKTRKLASLGGDVEKVSRIVNGGVNGLEDRVRRYQLAIKILGGASTTVLPILKEGARGPEVKRVQQLLRIQETGSFGPITKAALIRFQEQEGLTPDGILGPQTAKVLISRRA